jgi:hypothetical protein
LLDDGRIQILIRTKNDGSGSWRPKNIRIRIRIHNTGGVALLSGKILQKSISEFVTKLLKYGKNVHYEFIFKIIWQEIVISSNWNSTECDDIFPSELLWPNHLQFSGNPP